MKMSRYARLGAGLLVLVWLVLWFFFVPDGVSSFVIWVCLGIFYINLADAIQPVKVVPEIPSYFTARLLFHVMVYFILYYPYQLYVLGLFNLNGGSSVVSGLAYSAQTNTSIILTTIGVTAFNVGFFSLKTKINRVRRFTQSESTMPLYIIPAVTLLLMLLYVFSGGMAHLLAGFYSGSVTGNSTADGLYILVTIGAMWCACLIVYYRAHRRDISFIHHVLAISSVVLWALFLLVVGDRNMLFLVLVTLVAGYATFMRKLGLKYLVVGGFLALLSYNVIGVIRYAPSIQPSELIEAAFQQHNDHPLGATAFRHTTVGSRAALFYVPDQYDYLWGCYDLKSVVGIVPYLQGAISGSKGRHSKNRSGLDCRASSKLLTYAMLGASAGYGMGSNIVSDGYINFGVSGVIMFLFFLGMLARYMEKRVSANPKSLLSVALYLVVLACIFEMPRYDLTLLIRPVAWTIIIFWLVTKVRLGHMSRRQSI